MSAVVKSLHPTTAWDHEVTTIKRSLNALDVSDIACDVGEQLLHAIRVGADDATIGRALIAALDAHCDRCADSRLGIESVRPMPEDAVRLVLLRASTGSRA